MKHNHWYIERLTSRKEYMGFGYLGHEFRNSHSDYLLCKVASELGLGIDDIFLWANSRYGRYFMDAASGPTGNEFKEQLQCVLPDLKGESDE